MTGSSSSFFHHKARWATPTSLWTDLYFSPSNLPHHKFHITHSVHSRKTFFLPSPHCSEAHYFPSHLPQLQKTVYPSVLLLCFIYLKTTAMPPPLYWMVTFWPSRPHLFGLLITNPSSSTQAKERRFTKSVLQRTLQSIHSSMKTAFSTAVWLCCFVFGLRSITTPPDPFLPNCSLAGFLPSSCVCPVDYWKSASHICFFTSFLQFMQIILNSSSAFGGTHRPSIARCHQQM